MGTLPASWLSQQGYIPPSPLLSQVGTPSSSPYSDMAMAQAALTSVEITSLSSAFAIDPSILRENEATPVSDASGGGAPLATTPPADTVDASAHSTVAHVLHDASIITRGHEVTAARMPHGVCEAVCVHAKLAFTPA
ncbi:hypothetical protein V7S43_000412 [Phytophthora oleae]|uniref:Uncharacterized protein n=1 Tax=Phytophthora oleae TaxID=2107226 RepID=A0ABD3GBC8_9STRA